MPSQQKPAGKGSDLRPLKPISIPNKPDVDLNEPPRSPISTFSCHLLVRILSCLGSDNFSLRQARLVNSEFYAAATAAVRSLRPKQASDPLLPRFSGLQSIDFSAVHPVEFSESSLDCLSQARDLTALKFGNLCRLTSTGASHIVNLAPKLRQLELFDLTVSPGMAHQFSALQGLTFLSLRCCNVSEAALVTMFSEIKRLHSIELGSCSGVTDKVLAAIGKLPLVEHLDLSSNDEFTEAGLLALGEGPSTLKTLLMPACWQIDDQMMIILGEKFTGLKQLSLYESGEAVTDLGMIQLGKLTNLTCLDAGYSCWASSSSGLKQIFKKLKSLAMLNIGGVEGVDDSVMELVPTELNHLTCLDVSECQRMSVESVKALSKLPAIKELHLGWNVKLNGGVLSYLPRGLTKLDFSYGLEMSLAPLKPGALPDLLHFQARRLAMLNDSGLSSLVDAAPQLRHLDISYCANVSSGGLRSLSRLNYLSSLVLSSCMRAATVLGLGYLANVKSLESLEACNNPLFDDGCMQAVSFVRQLKQLCLTGCPRITDHGLMALVRLVDLHVCEIDGRNVTKGAVEKLQRKLPKLKGVRLAGRDHSRGYHYHTRSHQVD